MNHAKKAAAVCVVIACDCLKFDFVGEQHEAAFEASIQSTLAADRAEWQAHLKDPKMVLTNILRGR